VTFSRIFFRAAAVCSFLSAITTLLLIFLPRLYTPVVSFDDRIRRLIHAVGRTSAPATRTKAGCIRPPMHPDRCIVLAEDAAGIIGRRALPPGPSPRSAHCRPYTGC
jgi:hypothetical protein